MHNINDISRVLIGIDYIVKGEHSVTFDNAKAIGDCNELSITYCKKDLIDGQRLIEETYGSVVICGDDVSLSERLLKNKLFIVVNDPRLVFSRIIKAFFEEKPDYGIHPSAQIEESAKIDPEVYIGPFSYVGKRVKVGKGSLIHGNVSIYHDVEIGENVILNSGVVIGSDGFGYSRNDHGEWEKFPHIGTVLIKNDVEIGPNSCIDRGTLGATIIEKGVKLDNLVYVGHNAVIGAHTGISGNTTIGGSVIGKYCWIAPGCTIKEKIRIGNKSFVGIASVVTEDVEEESFVLGVPARKVGKNPELYPRKK